MNHIKSTNIHTQGHVLLCDMCASKVPEEIIQEINRAISNFRSEGCRPLEAHPTSSGIHLGRAAWKWHRNRLGLISRELLVDGTLFRASALHVYVQIQGVSWEPKKTSGVTKIVKSLKNA